MDKTSLLVTPGLPREELEELLRGMARAISSGQVRYLPSDGEVTGERVTAEGPFYPRHAHGQWEVVFSPRAWCRDLLFHWGGRWRAYRPGEVCVITPGALHTEKCARRRGTYRLLWVTVTNSLVGVHVTAYSPDRGYRVEGARMAFRGSVQDALLGILDDLRKKPEDSFLRMRFQALLTESVFEAGDRVGRGGEGVLTQSYQQQVVERVRAYVRDRIHERVTVPDVARLVHYSPCHLNAIFRKFVGRPIHRYLLDERLKAARRMLAAPHVSVKEAAYAVGFDDPLYFSRLFRRRFGAPPSQGR